MVIQGTALLTPGLERGVKNTHSNETAGKSKRAMTYRVGRSRQGSRCHRRSCYRVADGGCCYCWRYSNC